MTSCRESDCFDTTVVTRDSSARMGQHAIRKTGYKRTGEVCPLYYVCRATSCGHSGILVGSCLARLQHCGMKLFNVLGL